MADKRPNNQKTKIRELLDRLERISADSPWAHRASGIRASLAKHMASSGLDPAATLDLIEHGYQILEKAASEIPDDRA